MRVYTYTGEFEGGIELVVSYATPDSFDNHRRLTTILASRSASGEEYRET